MLPQCSSRREGHCPYCTLRSSWVQTSTCAADQLVPWLSASAPCIVVAKGTLDEVVSCPGTFPLAGSSDPVNQVPAPGSKIQIPLWLRQLPAPSCPPRNPGPNSFSNPQLFFFFPPSHFPRRAVVICTCTRAPPPALLSRARLVIVIFSYSIFARWFAFASRPTRGSTATTNGQHHAQPTSALTTCLPAYF